MDSRKTKIRQLTSTAHDHRHLRLPVIMQHLISFINDGETSRCQYGITTCQLVHTEHDGGTTRVAST